MYALGSLRHPQHCNQNFVYNFTFIHVFVGFQVDTFSQSNWAVPSVQYSHSVVSDFWDPMFDCSMPGFPVHHQFPELAQTQVHGVSDAIQPSHLCRPLLLPPSISPSIRVFSNESTLHIKWPKYWSFSIIPSNEWSGLIFIRINWFDLLLSKGLSRVVSNTTVLKHQLFGTQLSLWSSSHIHTWLLEKTKLWLCQLSNVSAF